MIRNYFKIAWRNLVKNKLYSMINLLGLTIGMTCFILIAIFIQFELSFDMHFEKADRMYRIVQQQKGNNHRGTDLFALAPLPLSIAIQSDFPEVEAVTNLEVFGALLIKDNESFPENGVYTDQYFFDVFSITVLEGMGKEALDDPNSILLTESLAKKMFGENSPISKTILHNSKNELIVRGIIADPPKTQHFTYEFIASNKLTNYYIQDLNNWASNNYHTYLTLIEGADYKMLEKKMVVYDQFTKPAYEGGGLLFYPKFMLQPLKDIYLYSNMNSETGINGNIQHIYIFAFIAFIILILASINYMNLATVKSAQRSKEVGVLKVLGARKKQLILQFLGESFMMTLFSFLLAIILVIILLPEFSELLNKDIPLSIEGNWWVFGGMLFMALLIGGLSGSYPAIFLSRINPVRALNGNFLKNYKDGLLLRNSLVIGQFSIAIGLIIGSVVIRQQLDFIQNKKLGYSREQVVYVPYYEKEINEKQDVIRTELLNHPHIQKVSISRHLPINLTSQGPIREWEGNNTNQELWVYRTNVDYDFIDLFEFNLVEGRGFSKEFATDSTEAYILNETAVKKLGWKKAVGKKFNNGTVIGVLEDFHLQTFDLSIEPLYMTMGHKTWSGNFGNVIMKIDVNDLENTRSFIQNTMKSIVPMAPYEVRFLEDSYAQLYDNESRLEKAFNIFSFLAIFIAGMGLFGLVSFQVLQRTKEIGIRKVLGSSITNIVGLLAKDFLKLILIAFAIAIPLAYYFMNNWLANYVYRIEIKWWVFGFVGLITLCIALATIGFQAVKAAKANPIKSLKTE